MKPTRRAFKAIAGRWMFSAPFLAALTLTVQPAPAEELASPATPAPQRREIWAPTEQLARVLQQYPKAVLLSREEYETLLRDAAQRPAPAAPEPPRVAALSSAHYTARVDGHLLRVAGELTVTVLTDTWAPVPLGFEGVELGDVKIDGEAALLPQAAEAQNSNARPAVAPGALLLRGRGEHVAKVEFTVPILTQGGESRVEFTLPQAAAGVFTVDLPPHNRAESSQALRVDSQPDVTHVTVAPDRGAVRLVWRPAADAAHSLPGMAQVEYRQTIDADQMHTEASYSLSTAFGNLPGQLEVPIPPECTALQAAGGDVADWSVEEGKVKLRFQPGERTTTEFLLVLQQPTLGADARASKTLPAPRITGMDAAGAGMVVNVDDSVEVGAIDLPAATEAVDPGPGNLARWQFQGWPQAAHIEVTRLQPRFSVNLDTLVQFHTDAIHLERTVAIHEEKGQLFHLDVTLPPGEETLEVLDGGGPADWRLEGGLLRLRWSDLLPPGKFRTLTIRTRLDPAGWTKIDATGLDAPVQDARIAGAANVSGYIALQSDGSFRLEAEASDQLERRDARTAPVHGEYAWFRREAFALKVHVARRPAEIVASVTGYALPREEVLDVHAQITWNFQRSGVRSVRVRTPGPHAAQFHFEGKEIAERNLDGDIWTITFQKDQIGAYPMQVAVQTPILFSRNRNDDDEALHFGVEVPVFEPLDVQRVSAVWAVEANTETEIEVKTKGMNELDALAAPALPGYAPQHRVIGVFGSFGADWHLSLHGVRHSRARLATTVIDSLSLTSVFSTSGAVRTLASLQVRAAGAQYIEVMLPERARLLSLTWAASAAADRWPLKPVEGIGGAVRAPLPAQTDSSATTMIDLLYETPGAEWSGAGGADVLAPQVVGDIPVLRSVWCAYLPDGFAYRGFDSNLRLAKRAQPEGAASRRASDWTGLLNPFGYVNHKAYIDPSEAFRAGPPLSSDDDLGDRTTVRNWFRGAVGDSGGVRSWKFDPAEFNRFAGGQRVEEALRAHGFSIAGDDRAVYLPHSALLVVKSDPATLEAFDGELQEFRRRSERATDENEEPRLTQEDHGEDRIRAKLRNIILPKLVLRDATQRECIAYLMRVSRSLDAEETDPLHRGVNIIGYEVETNEPVAKTPAIPGLSPSSAVTTSLTNVPLGEALRYITSILGLKYKITPQGVELLPLSVPTEVLVTREMRLPLGVFQQPDGTLTDAKKYFESNGVTFPPGASAVYLPKLSKLIQKNTRENLDTVDAIVQLLGSAPAAPTSLMDISGLLPMKLELPKSGHLETLDGLAAPKYLHFRYNARTHEAQRLWWCLSAGGAAAFLAGSRRWGWKFAWAILLLLAVPWCFAPAYVAEGRAALAGWFLALVLQKISERCLAPAHGKEAVA